MAGSIKAVLFDADGVVQTSNPVIEAVAELCAWDVTAAEAFLHEVWRREEELGCLVGAGELLPELAALLLERDASLEAAAFYADLLAATIAPAHHVLALVDELRATGVFCALATNQERTRLRFMTDTLGYIRRFDRIFGSCEMGVRKPTAEYFEAIVRELPMAPHEVLFLDDHAPNVDSARTVGLRAEVVVSVDEVADHLKQYGLRG
jgi:putative hydrolase of the HAD superfamily